MLILGPLWCLNLILVFLNFTLVIFLGVTNDSQKYFFTLKIPQSQEIFLPHSEIPKLEKLFDRDLFNTQLPFEVGEKIFVYQPTIFVNPIYTPSLPGKLEVIDQVNSEQGVLPPLQLVLRGTIIGDNPLYNKAFIENLRTKEEKDYVIGDIIEDAQIVFIGKSQINFIRSNGQEEMIYLNKLLKIEEEAIQKILWNKICYLNRNQVREINTYLLGLKIKSLASFIDELGLITFFEKNIPIGCLVTGAMPDSLASVFGLMNNDVLLSLNDISFSSVSSRIAAYEFVMKQKDNYGFVFRLALLRDNKVVEIDFLLESNSNSSTKHAGILNLKKIDKL